MAERIIEAENRKNIQPTRNSQYIYTLVRWLWTRKPKDILDDLYTPSVLLKVNIILIHQLKIGKAKSPKL